MPRFTIVMLSVFRACLSAPAKGDELDGSVAVAKREYETVFARITDSVYVLIDRQQKAARASGDPDAVERVAKYRAEFSASGRIPADVPVALERQLRSAQTKLERIYQEAIKRKLTSGDDVAAKDLQRELRKLYSHNDAQLFEDRYYKVFRSAVTWEEAYANCSRMKGRLVVIRSKTQNEFVTRIARDAGQAEVWIGASDKEIEGQWKWHTGEKIAYSNWHTWRPGDVEPNNYRGVEDYATLVTTEADWCDKPGTEKHAYVCMWE